ncbi:DUF3566 domain-containing protein [Gryllotalpicola ginsengisoli]|uniref:DUF3566 domain-containing protein n=1 Tax=Gryllotalpicola ginsengisoli TaxID=444608 RepID=UPI0003B52CE9|nr:DUF3566 domain-containing protein [Gryllotalpicola ginsengisoli]
MTTSVAERLARKTAKRPASKQVRLKLVYIDFWSSVKISFLAGLAVAIIGVVASFLLWTVLTKTGVFDTVDQLFTSISGQGSNSLMDAIGLGNVMSFSIIVGILDIVVITALGAVLALLYNLSVKITGGLLVGFTNS